jgi:hypothetical protein
MDGSKVIRYTSPGPMRARSSGGERYIDTVEVIGSKPIVPTILKTP